MEYQPLIYIIVPVYKTELYLRKCVDSVLAQTWGNFILYLVDDGSPDNCPAICNMYAQKDSRVQVIHRPNRGQAAARNSALEKIANGGASQDKYVVFIDSDDCVTPDYLEFLYRLLKDTNSDIAQCGHWIVYSESRKADVSPDHESRVLNRKQAMESLCYNGIYDVTVWNKIYKLSVFQDVRFPEGRIYEDTAVSHLVARKAEKIAVDMTPKYYYNQRYNSTANGRKFRENKYQFLQAGDELADDITAWYPDLQKAANVKRVFVRLSTLSQMVNADYYDRERVLEMRHVIARYAPDVIFNRKASMRDKIGTVLSLMGFPFYRAVWKLYYKIKRRKK